MSMMALTMFVIALFTLGGIYVSMKNLTKPKKNLILGVTVPYEERESSALREICKSYISLLNIFTVILGIATTGFFFMKSFSFVFVYFTVLFFAGLILQYVPYFIYHMRLKRLKKEKGWRFGHKGKLLVNTKAAEMPRYMPKWWWFLFPLFMVLLPIPLVKLGVISGLDNGNVYMSLTFALIIGILALSTQFIKRQRTETIDSDTKKAIELTKIRQNQWSKCCVWIAYLTALLGFAMVIFADNEMVLLVLSILYTAGAVLIAMQTEMKARELQQIISAESGKDDFIDEDEFWIFGLFYYNPHDVHVMKNERIGTGITMNMAKPAAKISMTASLLALLLLPIICVWTVRLEFTPKRLYIEENKLIAAHLRQEYVINLDTVDSLELIHELPKSSRVMGVGMDTLYKGDFSTETYGKCVFFLNPKEEPYIVIKTSNKNYIFGADDGSETESIYRQMAE
jgi:hypothetical protein